MPRLEIKRQLGDEDLAGVAELLDAVERADAHRLVGDHEWVGIARSGRRRYAGFLAREQGHEHPVAYAQLTQAGEGWAVELVISPHHRYDAGTIGPDLLRATFAVVAGEGGGTVRWWVHEPTGAHHALAADAGLAPERELLQLRRPLPAPDPPPLAVRSFRPGADDEAWLAVNNRAFADHPDQGGWNATVLAERLAEPWFDPSGFLLHDDPATGELAGFCWTKAHPGGVGEIYVIGVDPAYGGRGLGRALVLHGLDHLHQARGCDTGMLYVDGANEAALALYDRLGFERHHRDMAFAGHVDPA